MGEISIYELYPEISKMSPAIFGAMVVKWREANGLSRISVASRLGLSTAWMNDIENGMKDRPYITNFVALCKMMGFSVSDIRSLLYTFGINNVTSLTDVEMELAEYVLKSCDCDEEVIHRFKEQFGRRAHFGRYKRKASDDGTDIWVKSV